MDPNIVFFVLPSVALRTAPVLSGSMKSSGVAALTFVPTKQGLQSRLRGPFILDSGTSASRWPSAQLPRRRFPSSSCCLTPADVLAPAPEDVDSELPEESTAQRCRKVFIKF